MRVTHTFAELEVSASAYEEIRNKLVDAEYQHCFIKDGDREVIDMHGIALVKEIVQTKRRR